MSDMQRHQGIIKRLSTKENAAEVYKGLDIDREWDELDENGVPLYIEDERYEMVNGCIFDVSGAPSQHDSYGDVNEAVRLNDTDYRVHTYFYNGGASFSDMLDDSIPKADAEYEKKSDPKEIIREALARAKVDEVEAFVYVQQIYDEVKLKK